MTKTIGDYFILLLSIFGSLASIIAFGLVFAPQLDEQGWVGVAFLGIIAVFFLFYNLYLINVYRKKVRYANIFSDINIGFSYLHSINRNKDADAEDIIANLSDLCDNMATAFTKIYGNHIGVCIKFLIKNDINGPRVQTLVRDEYSRTMERKTGTSDKTMHWLHSNSDFDFIYSNFEDDTVDTSHYYEPHLPLRKDYRNTRLKNPWFTQKKFYLFENAMRRRLWPLAYRSTLVVPIVPLQADEQSKEKIRGFLCIDSPKEGDLNKETDFHILKGVSDGIFNQIDHLHQLMQQNLR